MTVSFCGGPNGLFQGNTLTPCVDAATTLAAIIVAFFPLLYTLLSTQRRQCLGEQSPCGSYLPGRSINSCEEGPPGSVERQPLIEVQDVHGSEREMSGDRQHLKTALYSDVCFVKLLQDEFGLEVPWLRA